MDLWQGTSAPAPDRPRTRAKFVNYIDNPADDGKRNDVVNGDADDAKNDVQGIENSENGKDSHHNLECTILFRHIELAL